MSRMRGFPLLRVLTILATQLAMDVALQHQQSSGHHHQHQHQNQHAYRLSGTTVVGPRRMARAAALGRKRLREELSRLRKEHEELKSEASSIPTARRSWAHEEVRRLKKSKLAKKDEIAAIEARLRRIQAERRKLGAGACGVVFEAVEVATGERLAAKRAVGHEKRAMLRREYEVLNAAATQGVVQARALLEDGPNDSSYLVLELLGPSLEHLLWTQTLGCCGFAPPIVDAVARDLLATLHDLASLGLCHGDLKPDNVLFSTTPPPTTTTPTTSNRRELVLIDFGSATYLGEEYPNDGTPAFRPRRRPPYAGFADDLESLALTLAYLLSGVDPPVGDPDARDARVLELLTHPTPADHTDPDAYLRTARFIRNLLQTARRTPKGRPPDYPALIRDARALCSESGPRHHPFGGSSALATLRRHHIH